MIVIDQVELSKNPVSTGETFIIRVQLHEEMATWGDYKYTTFGTVDNYSWDSLRRKIVPISNRNLFEGSANTSRSWDKDGYGSYLYLLRVDIASILPKVAVGDILTFSFDVEMEIGTILRVYDSNGHPGISYGSHTFSNIGSGKQRLAFTKTLVTGTRNTIYWYMDFYNNNNGDKFSISNIKVEYGDKATSWSPAPEDYS